MFVRSSWSKNVRIDGCSDGHARRACGERENSEQNKDECGNGYDRIKGEEKEKERKKKESVVTQG